MSGGPPDVPNPGPVACSVTSNRRTTSSTPLVQPREVAVRRSDGFLWIAANQRCEPAVARGPSIGEIAQSDEQTRLPASRLDEEWFCASALPAPPPDCMVPFSGAGNGRSEHVRVNPITGSAPGPILEQLP